MNQKPSQKEKNTIPLLRSLRTKSIIFFLVVSVIPLIGASWLTLVQSENAVRQQVFQQLEAVRNLEAERLTGYLQDIQEDIMLMSKFPAVIEAMQAFAMTEDFYEVRMLGYWGNPDLVDSEHGTLYDTAHARYHEMFKRIVETSGYKDIYLLSPAGDVIYNFDKGDDFGTNMFSGAYRNTHLAQLFQELYTDTNSDTVIVTDFASYSPSGGIPASFIGSPIVFEGKTIGVIIYQLPLARINDLMRKRASVVSKTGEVYLVGPDKLIRTAPRSELDNQILGQEIDTITVEHALANQTGAEQVMGYHDLLVLSAYQPLQFGSETWALIAEINRKEAFAPIDGLRNTFFGIIGVAVLLAMAVGVLTAQGIVSPILQLNSAVKSLEKGASTLGLTGNWDQSVTVGRRDEVGELARSFNSMGKQLQASFATLEERNTELKQYRDHLEDLVDERTRELEYQANILEKQAAELEEKTAETELANQELSKTIDELKTTQTQLVESEKMAALGGLVAGVAHEINTPVGLGLTMASTLEEETKSFILGYKKSGLKRSTLNAYLNRSRQSCRMILENLQWAASLVQSFKQVAVDQTSLENRTFAIKEYIEGILLNLTPKLKRTQHTVTVHGDESLVIDSYPGALSQVITNFVTNAIIHAYKEDETGQIQFVISTNEDQVIIEYSDDGCGIPPENLKRIFEPFFTTARSRGGSGLGMHIVYNLVTQKLKGSIRCESEVGVGTKFIIILPINLNKE